MKKILLYIILLLSGIEVVRALPVEKEGLKLYSAALKQDVCYSVVLPEGYDTSGRDYPVVYLFHGIGGDYTSWLEYGNVAHLMDKMIREGEIQPFIMVIPDGYVSYYSNTYDGTFPYEAFLTKELIPAIDKNWRTRKNAPSRSVIGFSMGGFGALSVSLRNRDLFGSVVALSPSIRTEKQYMEEEPQQGWDDQWGRIFGGVGKSGNQRLTSYYKERSPYHILSNLRASEIKDFGIMLDIGDKEGTLCESNEDLHRLLLERKISHEWEVRSGEHDFTCWNAALPKAFRFVNGYFKQDKQNTVSAKEQNETPVVTLPDATLYFPAQTKGNARKYPVIYVQGSIDKQQQQALVVRFHRLVGENKTWPAILSFINEGKNLSEAITGIERQCPEIRTSQRMRALLGIGESVEQSIRIIQQENWFTGIVCVNGTARETGAQDFWQAVSSHKRYPRCWIEVSPEFGAYGFSSNVHILMQQAGMEHEFRSRNNDTPFSYWEEWLIYLNNRIHV